MGRSINDVERGISTAPTGIDTYQARQELARRMERILKMNPDVYEPDPEKARLLALRVRLEAELGTGKRLQGFHSLYEVDTFRPPDRDRLVAAMVDAEIERMRAISEAVVPQADPVGYLGNPMPATLEAAEYERNEVEQYLLEVGRQQDALHAEGCARLRWPSPDCPTGPTSRSPVTIGLYEQYVGPGAEAIRTVIIKEFPALMSLALDFVPIVGQLKSAAEAIVGRDFITGRELPDWERGLNILLAVLPGAKGVFKAGKAGLRTLANVAVKSGRDVQEVYRVAKAASKLSEAEVRAAKVMQNGKPANLAEFEKVAGTLDEMMGSVPKPKGKLNFRVAQGLIEDNRGLGRSVASSPIQVPKPAKMVPGRAVKATKTAAGVAERLIKNGVTAKAIEALERVGVKVTDRLADVLIKTNAGGFVNTFHECSGFELVLRDLLVDPNKKKGAELVIEFVMDAANKIDPNLAKFELPVGITRRGGGLTEVASRATDLVITQAGRTLNYEFKAYSKTSLALWARKDPLQMAKDLALLGRQTMKWVFDSRKLSRSYVYKKLKEAIKAHPLLAKEFGDGAKLEKALDELVVMFPPVPKVPPLPLLQGAIKPLAGDDDEKRR